MKQRSYLLLVYGPATSGGWLFIGSDGLSGLGAAVLQHWELFVGAVLLVLAGLVLLRRTDQRYSENLVEALGQEAPPPAASTAAATIPHSVPAQQLVALLGMKQTRGTATDELVALGETGLPALQEALALEPDERHLQRLAQIVARIGTPAARQQLITVVHSANLCGRAAALQALRGFASVPADAPLFQRVVEEEMRLAQHILHGMVGATNELRAALQYELHKGLQRLFGLLLQLYEQQPLLKVQRGIAHLASERQARYLQALENLIPRPLYRGLQALLIDDQLHSQVHRFDELLGPVVSSEPIPTTIVRRGVAAFSAWTISTALRQWHPQPATVSYLYPHLQSISPLIQESAWKVLRQLPVQRPAAYDQLLADYPAVAQQLAATRVLAVSASAQERVMMLKATALFVETPENVLGNIVPIMKQVTFQAGQKIFDKGALGTSLFIVCEGEVAISNGARQLTIFRRGDFFGELALLGAEPRSASAVAQSKTVAFRLDQEDFYDVMVERSEVLHNILRALCQRLRQQNEKAQLLH